MEPIAIQKYYKVRKEMDLFEFKQKIIEEEREMCLYKDKIVTKYHEFPIQKILDISFRTMGEEGGLLYLHTLSGVYSFTLKTSPEQFIEAYRALGKW